MQAWARKLAWTVTPGLMADRAVAWNQKVRTDHGLVDEARSYTARNGTVVSAGPFAGLRYPDACEEAIDSLVAKLRGEYERELRPVVAEAIARRPLTFVDIGTADGYYAVGFAHATAAVTYGFEPSRRARALCAEVAALNDTQVRLNGACTSRQLRRLPLEGAVVLSDCEGAEAEIFDERAVDALRSAFVVIELHAWRVPGVASLLRRRFTRTHEVEVVTGKGPIGLRQDVGTWLVLRPSA